MSGLFCPKTLQYQTLGGSALSLFITYTGKGFFQSFAEQLSHIVFNLLTKPLKFHIGRKGVYKQFVCFDVQNIGNAFYKLQCGIVAGKLYHAYMMGRHIDLFSQRFIVFDS